jgi:hypothetical protein
MENFIKALEARAAALAAEAKAEADQVVAKVKSVVSQALTDVVAEIKKLEQDL